jgi:Protoglobin
MPNTKSMEEHLQYLELDQDLIFELRKVKDILEPDMEEVLDNLYAHLLDEPEFNSLSCDKLEIDQPRSVCVTLSPC